MSIGMKDHDITRLAVCSDLRKNILISLKEGDKSLGDLRERLDISSTTAIHALRDLEKHRLTQQDKERKYCLTNIGRVIALKLMDFEDAADVLKKHERFWLEHNLSGIPEHMLEKIGWLKDSEVIQINPLDIIKTHSSFVSSLIDSKWIRGVSPIYSSDYTNIFKELIEHGSNTQLILTEPVLMKTLETIGQKNLRNAIKKFNLEVLVIDENLKIAFTCTDTFLSLGLFTNNGVYDTAHDLTCSEKKAIKWGNELFEYYRGKATEYKI